MENKEFEQEIFYKDRNDYLITEEELENIHPDLDQNLPYLTMNSDIISIHYNDTENIIDDPEDFFQYCSWLLIGHKGELLHPTTIKVTTEQPMEDQNPMC